MYQALYRKYRPQSFDEVVGQKVIVKTLLNAIKNNKITHAYLFTGPRGTGKTSIAKIFAKTINCENLDNLKPCNKCTSCMQINNKQTVDIIEIDAASNNGVDEIREIKNKVNLVPTNGKYKVYIIDEVHMLTQAAFNAMLKTLEEPPKNVIFILATTEPHKIPLTILSRCQRFDFKRITNQELVDRLNFIIRNENIEVEDGVLELIAEISNGGMRDSIGLLDQLITYCDSIIKIDDIHELNGSLNTEQTYAFCKAICNNRFEDVFNLIDGYNQEGKNLSIIIEQVVEFLKNVLIYGNCSNYFENNNDILKYEDIYKYINEEKLYFYIDNFLNTLQDMKYQNNKKLLIDLCIVKICNEYKESQTKEYKKIEEKTDVKKQDNSKENIKIKKNNFDEEIKKIKDIRLNNTLATFDKKKLLKMKEELKSIENYINNKTFSSVASLILDGELKACGNDYLIFVYKNETLENYFNSSLILIEKLLKTAFSVNYKPIAVNLKNWEIIKNDFNNSIKNKQKKYIFKDENYSLENIFYVSTETKENVKNDIDNMFGEIVEYK